MNETRRHGPGRPQDLAKRRAILESAELLLLDEGDSFTMEAVAQRAGVAKQTVYNAFPTKQILIASVVEQRIDKLIQPMTEATDDAPMETVLTAMATRYMSLVMNSRGTSLIRLMIRVPSEQVSSFFRKSGPLALQSNLSAYLDRMVVLGRVKPCDTSLAAEHFLGLIKGNLQLLQLLGSADAPPDEEQARRTRAAIDVFLGAYARKPAIENSNG